MWETAFLDSFQTVDIAKIGDAERKQIIVEYTLVCKNPLANSKAHGVA